MIEHYVIDRWHPDADRLRAEALSMPFDVPGNYPGFRTEPHVELCDYAQVALVEMGYTIGRWPLEYNGAFQLCLAGDATWVHSDMTDYAAVWFLTPGELCPPDHGTTFYRHRATGYLRRFGQLDPPPDEFEPVLSVEGLFNRLLVYDAHCFHASTVPGFGTGVEDGRLTATFFWS